MGEVVTFFSAGFLAIVKAVLILFVALVVATIVKDLIMKLLAKAPLGRFMEPKDTDAAKIFIGKLGYLIVFLLFVPGILQTLQLDSISTPLVELLNRVWGYVPNVLAAIVVLVIGIRISILVRQLLVPVFDKLQVNKLQEKLGISVPEKAKLSATLAYIVYVLILVPVLITALSVLGVSAISLPAIAMLNTIVNMIPNIVVALVLLVIGILLGKLIGQIVERLIAASGIDAKLKSFLSGQMSGFSISEIAGRLTCAVVTIFLAVEAVNVLHLQVLMMIGSAVIAYMPYVLAALLIFLGALVLSAAAGKYLSKYGKVYAVIAKAGIMTVCAFLILSQLKIASTLVNAAFILIIGSLAVAFAISFGIGGRQFAANMLSRLESRITNEDVKTPSSKEDSDTDC